MSSTFAQILPSADSLQRLSQEFIYASKTGDHTQTLEATLSTLSFESLHTFLKTDDEKKAFWINLYNGYTQSLLKKDSAQYKHRSAFFKQKFMIAGKKFSLDKIEHGILRHSKNKLSLGYLQKLFPGKTEKKLRVHKLDCRIHFALNCGAKSCPPIAFYDATQINRQLDVAAKLYLKNESVYNAEKNSLQLPAFMGWFRHDFRGKKNMIRIAKQYSVIPNDVAPKVSFLTYDWTLYLNNYKN